MQIWEAGKTHWRKSRSRIPEMDARDDPTPVQRIFIWMDSFSLERKGYTIYTGNRLPVNFLVALAQLHFCHWLFCEKVSLWPGSPAFAGIAREKHRQDWGGLWGKAAISRKETDLSVQQKGGPLNEVLLSVFQDLHV